MAAVLASCQAVVASDSTRVRIDRVRGAEDFPARLNHIVTFPNHGANRARNHERDDLREVRPISQVSIVFLTVFLAGVHQLNRNKLVSFLFKVLND